MCYETVHFFKIAICNKEMNSLHVCICFLWVIKTNFFAPLNLNIAICWLIRNNTNLFILDLENYSFLLWQNSAHLQTARYYLFLKLTFLCNSALNSLIVKVKSLSRVRLFATPWTTAFQAPPSMGFSRQEYWSELPFPSPENLPLPGI